MPLVAVPAWMKVVRAPAPLIVSALAESRSPVELSSSPAPGGSACMCPQEP